MRRSRKKVIAMAMVPILFTIIAIGLYVIGFHQIWDVGYSQWKSAIIKGAPEYSYESMLNVSNQATDGSLYYGEVRLPEEGTQFGELICENIELDAPIYCGDTEEILEKGVGVYAAGSMPGEQGTILAGAHDSTYFAALEKIKVSDTVTIKTTYGVFEYEVSDIQIVDISTQRLELDKEQEQLLLYTCYPFGIADEVRTQRYFVWAKKISGPEIKEAE